MTSLALESFSWRGHQHYYRVNKLTGAQFMSEVRTRHQQALQSDQALDIRSSRLGLRAINVPLLHFPGPLEARVALRD
jgi:hypothetical protein